jgi:hypothetical protein
VQHALAQLSPWDPHACRDGLLVHIQATAPVDHTLPCEQAHAVRERLRLRADGLAAGSWLSAAGLNGVDFRDMDAAVGALLDRLC